MPFVDAMKSEGWDEIDRELTEVDLYNTLRRLSERKGEIAGDPLMVAYLERDLALLSAIVSDIKAMAPKVAA